MLGCSSRHAISRALRPAVLNGVGRVVAPTEMNPPFQFEQSHAPDERLEAREAILSSLLLIMHSLPSLGGAALGPGRGLTTSAARPVVANAVEPAGDTPVAGVSPGDPDSGKQLEAAGRLDAAIASRDADAIRDLLGDVTLHAGEPIELADSQ